ncbi:hypothetical protein [Serinibacter arcticus]|uniref:Putative minor silk ampullate protein n=1 Tax=Serinibacter arcticus TaxID=1655435 RepID=A0A4Z1E482_9MICO|nr:hypothetical protein [Serinibacter arcticus]TGO06756.1 putative minor silk ampullate protein [Serinibacter arcticus]
MITATPPRTRTATLLAGAGALALAALGLAAGGGAAVAAPAPQNGPTGASVAVVGPSGGAAASPDGETTLSLSGSGFQSIDGGFGGIYVLFGWVADGAWQPSAGGAFGVGYAYQPDAQAAENSGYQKFVTFPGSTTASEANGSELALDGTWATELVIPGPVLSVTDAAGANPRDIDCRVETCGVITFGAHGVVNANNETFTPISFAPVAEAVAPVETAVPEPAPTETPEPSETEEPVAAEPSTTAAVEAAEEESVGSAEADAGGGGSSAAPWAVAGSAAAAGIGAATAAIVAARRRRASDPDPAPPIEV